MIISNTLAFDSVEYEPRSSSWCGFSGLRDKIAALFFWAATYLTDPVCKAHEYYRRISVVDALNPESSDILNLARKIALFLGLIGWAAIATFTSLPAIALRFLGSCLQKNPFIHDRSESQAKALPLGRFFTLLSWNICCVGGGYAITDGGVLPWHSRIDDIIAKIVEKEADVNCLYETFDAKSAFYLCQQLKQHGYSQFYFNIGPKAVGVCSGIFVASKYNIQNPEFIRFPQDTLVGRTKNAAKGVFSFDLESGGENFARVFSTHLQHSEEPAFPTPEEVEARRRQMEIIVEKVKSVWDRCIVVTGDLNLDDEEYNASSWQNLFLKENDFGADEKTWGGDEFCARLMEKRISRGLNLDHTMIVNGTAHAINTSLVKTGYNPCVYQENALSDHEGLFSRIEF